MFRLLALVAVLAVPAFAMADDDALVGGPCAGPSDCPLAFTCESVEMPCPALPCTEICPPCVDGEICDPCEYDCPDVDACTPTTEQRCVLRPQACETDADCSIAGFGCWPSGEMCSGGGSCDCPPCAAGEECAPCDCQEEEEECTSVGGGYCLPANVPCGGDAACSDGWSCVAIETGGGDVGCGCACPSCRDGEECPPCECDCGGEPGDGARTAGEGICMPAGWEEQISYIDEDRGGTGSDGPRAPDGAEMGGGAAPPPVGAGASGCTAGAGGAGSALAFAAALGLLRRRR